MNNKASFLGSRITIVGIGGERLFYIAKFLKLMGKEVEGYDYRKSDNTKKLESLGIKIKYSNPGPDFSTDSDLIIYSELLPAKVLRPVLKFRNLCHCERERSNLNATSGLPRSPAASISLRDRHATLAMTKR